MDINILTNGVVENPFFHESDYLVNNFTETNNLSGWAFGTNTFENGIVTLTGTSPNIVSNTFVVNPNDIIVFEFTVAITKPSTTTSGPGLYLGTSYSQSVYVHSYNYTTKNWSKATSTKINPYFLHSYNSSNKITMKSYILGSAVNLDDVPPAECTNNVDTRCIQLTGSDTTTYIRSGYNSNSSMIIEFSNPKIYRLNNDFGDKVKISNNYFFTNNYYEK